MDLTNAFKIDNLIKPAILKPGFNIKERIKSVNQKLNDQYEKDQAYINLTDKEKDSIDDNMKRFYRTISFDNLAEVLILLQKGKITVETINQNGAFALQLAVKADDPQLFKTLVEYGANPNSIDPKTISDPAMKKVVKEEQYKSNHPIKSMFESYNETQDTGVKPKMW